MLLLQNLLLLVLLLVLVFGIPTFFQYLIDKKAKEKQRILEKEEEERQEQREKEELEKWREERIEERKEEEIKRAERAVTELRQRLKKNSIEISDAEIEENLGIKLGSKLDPVDFLANSIQEPKDKSKLRRNNND